MRIKVSRFGSLLDAQTDACSRVDTVAEQVRLKYLTPGSGQAMEYEEAYRQALEFVSNPSGHYSMLEADVEAGLCETVEEAASAVIAMRQKWEQAGQTIRQIRLCAKRRIREATDTATVVRIREQAIAELQAV